MDSEDIWNIPSLELDRKNGSRQITSAVRWKSKVSCGQFQTRIDQPRSHILIVADNSTYISSTYSIEFDIRGFFDTTPYNWLTLCTILKRRRSTSTYSLHQPQSSSIYLAGVESSSKCIILLQFATKMSFNQENPKSYFCNCIACMHNKGSGPSYHILGKKITWSHSPVDSLATCRRFFTVSSLSSGLTWLCSVEAALPRHLLRQTLEILRLLYLQN